MTEFTFGRVLDLIGQTPDLKAALAPLLSHRPALSVQEPAGFPLKKMALWLWGISETCEDLFAHWCVNASSEDQLYFEAVKKALARDPEPPIEWLARGARHTHHWLQTGHFSFTGYYTLRRLHFLTRGYSTVWIRFLHQYYLPVSSMSSEVALPQDHLQALNTRGYTQFSHQLGAQTLKRIRQFATETPCFPSYHEPGPEPQAVLFDAHKPVARRYDFDYQEMWQCPDIQEIAAQARWFNYASDFLKSPAKLVQAYLWWSVATDLPESRTTGQVFHVDLDRFHFVNCFFYLTDVSQNNGPHQYIAGSQLPPPLSLCVDQRWTEEQLVADYGDAALQTLTGQAGTVIMGDTRAFHRGKPLQEGARLMLQLEFASSTLCDPAPVVRLPSEAVPVLAHAVKQHPERYPIFCA